MRRTHPELLQKPTLFVAERQFVPGALRHVALPVYTVHAPPHTLSMRWLQYVTVVVSASRETSPVGAFTPGMGSPTKVSLASVVLSQLIISSWVRMSALISGCERGRC